jgi:hypothetical protein
VLVDAGARHGDVVRVHAATPVARIHHAPLMSKAPKDERRKGDGDKSLESGPMGTDHEHG